MATNDTYLLSVIGSPNGQQHVHTLHFRQVDPTTNAQALIDRWQSLCDTAYRGMFHNAYPAVQLIRAAQICGTVPLEAAVEETIVGAPGLGTRATASAVAPAFLAVLVRERTALAGKSRRGRFFIGGMMEEDFTGDNVDTVEVTRVQAYLTALMGAFVTGPPTLWQLVVHSRKLALPGVQCQDCSTPVTSLQIATPITTMRSRKVGHGI